MDIGYQSENGGRLTAVRKDIIDIKDKIKTVGDKLYRLDEGLNPLPERVGEVESNMNTYGGQLDDLEHRTSLHSRRLNLLRQELDYVKQENDVLLGHVKNNDTARGEPVQVEPLPADYGNPFEQNREIVNNDKFPKNEPFQEQRPLSNGYKNGRPEDDVVPVNNKDYNSRRGESRSSETSVDDMYREEEKNRKRRELIYGPLDSTAINPQRWEPLPRKGDKTFDYKKYPHPGGFLFMRFDDSGYEIARDALTRMQPIIRNAGGHLLGMARKQRIFVYEVAPSRQLNWLRSRRQPNSDYLMTENTLAVFWFMKKESASEFLESTHNNKFREPGFPTPYGYEAVFVPLLVSPPIRPYNCFMFIEFIDARQYSPEDLAAFEGEVRDDMKERFPNSMPMVASSLEGKQVFKPGIFVSPYSKLYICRFQTQNDVDDLWKMGMIQGLRYKYRLTGPINAFSFVIDC